MKTVTISTIKIDARKCKGCGYCVKFCPKNLIHLDANFNEKGYHAAVFTKEENCTGCGLCGLVCPDVAIVVYKETLLETKSLTGRADKAFFLTG